MDGAPAFARGARDSSTHDRRAAQRQSTRLQFRSLSTHRNYFSACLPALRSSQTDLQETLKDSSSTTTDSAGKRLRGTLVVAEVAFSVALLVGAGLLVKSLVLLLSADNGFDPNGVLTMELKVSRNRDRDRAELSRLLQQVLQAVQSQPGVEKATLSAALPGITDGWQTDIAARRLSPRRKRARSSTSIGPSSHLITSRR